MGNCTLDVLSKNITIFHLKIINFTAEKNRSILHRRVIVAHTNNANTFTILMGKVVPGGTLITTRSVVFMLGISQKKQKCSVPCSALFSSRYIDEIKIFRQRFVSGSVYFTYLNLLVSIFILFTETNQIYRTRSILNIIKGITLAA